ncbi:mucin-binding protein, partial [Streptococcus suis]|uniref:mucin-binding protein n=1 Tax=Streptococcus suis TaxID=1307 RepID=UPI003AF8B5BC
CNDAGEEIATSVEQELLLTRKANVSLPTGRISYGDWSGESDVFPEIEVPEVAGYKPHIDKVGEQKINSDTASQVVTVVYQHNPQQINVYYLNSADNSKVFVDEIMGRVGEKIHYIPQKRLV